MCIVLVLCPMGFYAAQRLEEEGGKGGKAMTPSERWEGSTIRL